MPGDALWRVVAMHLRDPIRRTRVARWTVRLLVGSRKAAPGFGHEGDWLLEGRDRQPPYESRRGRVMLFCPACNQPAPQRVTCASCKQAFCPGCSVVHAQDKACTKNKIIPYPYQTEAIDRAWEHIRPGSPDRSAFLTMATGLGKTVVAALIAKRWIEEVGTRVLLLAHREELVFQAAKEIGGILGKRVEVEMASNRANRNEGTWTSKVVAASVPTLVAGRSCPVCQPKLEAERAAWLIVNPDKKLEDWSGTRVGCNDCMGGMIRRLQGFETPFGLVIVDECFVAGTLVDGRPIETIKAGDYVNSFNHMSGRIERRLVVRTFKGTSNQILRVKLSNGNSITCTAGHPFWSPRLRQYIPAAMLTSNELVLTITKKGVDNEMRIVRKSDCDRGQWKISPNLLRRMPQQTKLHDNGCNQQDACVCQDDCPESYGSRRRARESFSQAASNGMEADHPQGQRAWSNSPSKFIGMCVGVADGGGNTNQKTTRKRLSHMLQGGHWERGIEDSDRSRRKFPRSSEEKSAGPKENETIGTARVESIEILQCGSAGELGGGSSSCDVYNIEVEENHNYFAEGVLVHNCHHATAKSYQRIVEYASNNWNASILGVTATPDRTDEKKLGIVLHHEAYKYELTEAIRDGWLVNPQEFYVRIDSWNLSRVDRDRNDFKPESLAKEVEASKACQEVAAKILEHTSAANLKTICFFASVHQAHEVAALLNAAKPGTAIAIDGKTDKQIRRKTLLDFAAGRIQYLCNYGVFTEGFNERTIQCLVNARPTKSRNVYVQILGRGTRTLAGVLDGKDTTEERLASIAASAKPNLLVLDLHGQAGAHELVTMIDVIGARLSPNVIDIVRKLARENPGKTVDELREIDKQNRIATEQAARARAAARQMKSTLIPSRQSNNMPKTSRPRGEAPPPEKTREERERNMPVPVNMVYAMRALGIDEEFIRSTNKFVAGKAIGKAKHRRTKGLCNWDQSKKLRAMGIIPTEVSYVDAVNIISSKVTESADSTPIPTL